MKLLPRRAHIRKAARVERVARFPIVCEGVAQHQGSVFCELMIQLACGFGFRSRDGEKIGGDLACRQARESARREERIDRGCDGGIDVRPVLASIVLLLDRHIVKRSILDDRAAQRKPGAIAAEGWFPRFVLERVARIERCVLRKNKCVAVNRICSRARDDVDRPAGSSARFRREAILHDLKFLDDFRRKFGAARSGVLVVVVEPVDRYRVAASAQTAEREAAAGERRASRHRRRRRRAQYAGREENEIQRVAALNGQFLNSLAVHRRHDGSLRDVERLLLGVHADFFGTRRRNENDIQMRGLAERQIEVGKPVGRKTGLVHAHFIGTNGQRLHVERALRIRFRGASLIRGSIAHDYGRSGYCSAAAISDRSFQSGRDSGTLSTNVGRARQHNHRSRQCDCGGAREKRTAICNHSGSPIPSNAVSNGKLHRMKFMDDRTRAHLRRRKRLFNREEWGCFGSSRCAAQQRVGLPGLEPQQTNWTG